MQSIQVVEAAIEAINPQAMRRQATHAAVDVEWVLARVGFDAASMEDIMAEQQIQRAAPTSSSTPPAPAFNFGVPASSSRPWHGADGGVGSVYLTANAAVDLSLFNEWIRATLTEHGADLYRYKGLLAVAGQKERYIFQGVHMLFTGRKGRKWQEGEVHRCQLVLIGRRLPGAELEAGFLSSLV